MGGENNALGKKVTFVSTFREYQMCKIQKQIVCETQQMHRDAHKKAITTESVGPPAGLSQNE